MSLCPDAAKRDAMTDAEFWEHVLLPQYVHHHEPEAEDYPELVPGDCLRCGEPLVVEDYAEMRDVIDTDAELCDTCADELQPDEDAMYPPMLQVTP